MPEKLIHGKSSVGDDAPERSLSDLPMVGHDHTGEWVAATKDHMAAGLTAELEPGTFQSQANLASRQIGGQPGHDAGEVPPPTYAASTSTNSFPTSVGIGSPASRQSSI